MSPPNEGTTLNLQVFSGNLARRLFGAISQGCFRLAEVYGGLLFLSPFGQTIWSLRLHRWRHQPRVRVRTAIVAHVFYPELLPEILACKRCVGADVDLHITTTSELSHEIQDALLHVSGVHIHLFPNRGRDIAPFLGLLNAGVFHGYDAVLKIHTKRSPHLRNGEIRRQLLFTVLAGKTEQVTKIIALFENPDVGMVGWRSAFRTHPSFMMANWKHISQLVVAMGRDSTFRVGCFERSMFWFRPKALEPLRQLRLAPEAFEVQAGQLDGTFHHAIERLFPHACTMAAFRCVAISGQALEGNHSFE